MMSGARNWRERTRGGRALRFILGVLPWIGLLVGPIFANHVHPFVLGMPFLLFWMVLWVVLTALCMALVFVTDPANRKERQE